jgi:hypothetical protein
LFAAGWSEAPKAIDDRKSALWRNAADHTRKESTMGDRKGKKDKAKDKRQKKAKDAKDAKEKQDKQRPRTPPSP